jgi:hypothetical protein
MIKKHKINLDKLATYLEALPADYREFDMRDFNTKEGDEYAYHRSLDLDERVYGCGTAACAVGHGPAAGVRPYADRNWFCYAERAFGVGDGCSTDEEDRFEYLFGSSWTSYDNTPHGAAARIRKYLDLGGKTPLDWEAEREQNAE